MLKLPRLEHPRRMARQRCPKGRGEKVAYNTRRYLWTGAPRVVFARVAGRFRAPNSFVGEGIFPLNRLDVAEVAKNRSRCLLLTTHSA